MFIMYYPEKHQITLRSGGMLQAMNMKGEWTHLMLSIGGTTQTSIKTIPSFFCLLEPCSGPKTRPECAWVW